jgi:predicted SnoaL-like aldol condensation-catalyzing enzyme
MASLITTSNLTRRHAVRLGGASLAMAIAAREHSAAAANHDQVTLEANKAIARRVLEEAFNSRNGAVIAELYASDYVDRGGAVRQMPGPAGLPLTLDDFQTLVPDVTVSVDAIIAEGDLVSTHATWYGTHPPAGTHVVGRTMHIFRLASGQIVEQWSVGWDWIAARNGRPASRPGNPLIVG